VAADPTGRSRLTRTARPVLAVLLDGAHVGVIYRAGNQRLTFVYEEAWRESSHAFPLSVSMPLVAREHRHRAITNYLWGLLPDNADVLESWAKQHRVSRWDVVELLEQVGEDVAGAAQFCRPDRVAHLIDDPGTARKSDVSWLTTKQVAARLRHLRENPGSGRARGDHGQFSLAGQQPKTALFRSDAGRWAVPGRMVPTTHILKPPVSPYPNIAVNEVLCAGIASELGLDAMRSQLTRFDDELAVVIPRYDREWRGGRLHRLHQEDFCQATANPPTRRYETNGGPGVADIVGLLRSYSVDATRDVARFVDANIFAWLTGGTDAHAKNYSLMLGPRRARLAPLYDLISALPYPTLTPALAMSIGGERRIAQIRAKHWKQLARDLALPPDDVIARIRALSGGVASAVERALPNVGDLDRETFHAAGRIGLQIAEHAVQRAASI
jgi:serine/threonine-protein kinase HipA